MALWARPAIEERHPQHIMELKYQVQGPVDRTRGRMGRQAMTRVAFDHVGRTREDRIPVTPRVFLDEPTYRQVPHATFKAPVTIDDPLLPPSLDQGLWTYLRVRHHVAGESVCSSPANLTKLILSLYATNTFDHEVEGVAWYLVGAAAMGVPYFWLINSGLILGSRLAQLLVDRAGFFWLSSQKAIARYNQYRPWLVATEFGLAMTNDAGINAYEAWRQAFHGQSSAVPLLDDEKSWETFWAPDCQSR